MNQTVTKLNADPATLSNTARAMLWASWMSPRSTLRFEMRESVPSEKAAAALTELEATGLVQATRDPNGAVTYALTEAGKTFDRRPPGNDNNEKWEFMENYGRFPIAMKKPEIESPASETTPSV